jgi:lysophospholipase L1-like esterase
MNVSHKRLLVISVIFNVIFCSLGSYLIYSRGGMSYIKNRVALVVGARTTQNTSVNTASYLNRYSLFKNLPKTESAIIFLGDSITDLGEWSELLSKPGIINRGISGDTVNGIFNRLDDITTLKPKKVFLMIGINDIAAGKSLSEIISVYDKILDKFSKDTPGSQIILQSVLPINYEIYSAAFHSNSNLKKADKIVSLNKGINKLADKYKFTYVDLYTPMASQEGKLKPELSNDGIHLNGDGYDVWTKIIYSYVTE